LKKFTALLMWIMTILIVFLIEAPVYAVEKNAELDINENINKAVFSISWEKGTGSVELIDPQGTIYNKESLKDAYVEKDKGVFIFLSQPALGKWQVKVKGQDPGKILVEVSEFQDLIKIDSFTVEGAGDNENFNITWSISNVSSNIEFTVFADKDNSGDDGIEVYSFYGESSGSRTIKVDNLSYGDYYFYLRARASDKTFDTMYCTNPLPVINSSLPAKVENITASLEDDMIKIKWEKATDYNVKSYRVMFFEKGAKSPYYFYDTEELEFESIIEDVSNREFAVAALNGNDIYGAYERLSIDEKLINNLKAEVTFPEGEVQNTQRLIIEINFQQGLKAAIRDGETVLKDNITKSGRYILNLNEGNHQIVVTIQDDKGNIKNYSKSYYIDTYAPQLNLTKDYDGIKTTASYITLAGDIEPNAKLYINDKEVEKSDTGVFSHKMKLAFGKNKVSIKAIDPAGNQSSFEGTITRAIGADFIRLVIFFIIIALSIVFIVFLYNKKKRGNN
jgi:hypothetical protein